MIKNIHFIVYSVKEYEKTLDYFFISVLYFYFILHKHKKY